MKLLSINYPKQKEDEEKMDYLNRMYRINLAKMVKADNRMIRLEAPKETGAEAIAHKASAPIQLKQLMHRSWTLAKREPRLSRAKLLQTIIVAVLMMGSFWQVNDYASKTSVQDMAGAIYFMTIVQMFLNF